MNLGKIAAIGATIITGATVLELALIGTRATAEDISFVKACVDANRAGQGSKVKKILFGKK